MLERYPRGTGWWAGVTAGAAFGVFAAALTGGVRLGLVLMAAIGTPLGVAIERRLETRSLTPGERRLLLLLLGLGTVGFVVALLGI